MYSELELDCIYMREDAKEDIVIAMNRFNLADCEYEIDKAIYSWDLAERKLEYAVKLSNYLKNLPQSTQAYNENFLKTLSRYVRMWGGSKYAKD